jgi:alpha-mannosidase
MWVISKIVRRITRLWDSPTLSTVSSSCHSFIHCTDRPASLVRSGASALKALPSFVINGPQSRSIVLETIKTAEESNAVVLRLYEALGGRGKGTLNMYVDPRDQADSEEQADMNW